MQTPRCQHLHCKFYHMYVPYTLVVKRCSLLSALLSAQVFYPSMLSPCVMMPAHTRTILLLSAHMLLSACFLIASCYKHMRLTTSVYVLVFDRSKYCATPMAAHIMILLLMSLRHHVCAYDINACHGISNIE